MTTPSHPLHAHRIVCVGDSITGGFADPDNWPYHLKSRLDEDWDVINQGVGGAFTGYMLGRIDAALDLNPQFVVIMGGINDLRSGIAPKTIQVNIDAICTHVGSCGSVPVLCTVTPASDYVMQLADLNAWITEYARLKGYALIDFYAVINNKSNPGRSDPTLVSWDGTHPNAAGYVAMGNAIDLGIFTRGNRNRP
jgi:acyl-CoA thioesterase-1